MEWELIINQHSSLQEFRLTEDNKCKVIVKYNPRHQSARLTDGINQRLSFIENGGSLSGKTIFRNEYGMEIGSIISSKWDNTDGYIIIDNKKYFYQLPKDSSAELIIFNNNARHPLSSCTMKNFAGTTSNSALINNHNIACLLLSLGWYVYLPTAKEPEMEYVSL